MWLQDRRRTYAAGLSLFLATATQALLAKYGSQLQLAVCPPEFSIEFTTLINKLTEIRRNAQAFPNQFPGAYEEVISSTVQTLSENEIQTIIDAKQAKHDALFAKLAPDTSGDLVKVQEQLDALTDETITDIQAQIDTLSEEIDELKKPGVKFIKESSLPAAMAKNYNRIKEIVPLMASLHGELSDMSITGGERMDIAEKLCTLDDEKRALWDAIDVWSESTGVNASALRDAAAVATAGAPAEETAGAPGATATDGSLEAGAAIARRVLQVKQNITRSQAALNVANQEGNEKNIKSAQTRLDKYQAELITLESQIKGE